MALTQQEAQDRYYNARNRYEQAADKAYWANQEQNFRNEKSYTAAEIKSCKSERINFEKRLAGIEDIIRVLEGSGGLFSSSVPKSITEANNSLQSTNSSYSNPH